MDGGFPDCNIPMAIAYDDGDILVDDAGKCTNFFIIVSLYTDRTGWDVLRALDWSAHQLVAYQEGSERTLRISVNIAAYSSPSIYRIKMNSPDPASQTDYLTPGGA